MNSSTNNVLRAMALAAAFGNGASADDQPPPLPIEPTGIIQTLPKNYPHDWFLVHDTTFNHMSDGKVYVLDVSKDTVNEQVKGMFNVSLVGNIKNANRRGEIYAAETFHSRGTRGKRMDVVTIWDKENLSPVGEVILPGARRSMAAPMRYAMLLIDNERWLAVANFSPATSVTLIDLDSRKIINEIPTPGCSYAYPAGKRGFSSLCSDGRFMSTKLNLDGSIASQTRTESFFDSDDSPIFERAALIGSTAYFPSFAGLVYPVDIAGKVAKPGQPWHLVPEAERAERWAPSGFGIIDWDDLGRFYVLMHPDAKDGSHNHGGPEVWVYDPVQQQRVMRIPLQAWGVSLAVNRGDKPQLLVTNPIDMSVELYDALSGKYIRKISDFGQETPVVLRAGR